MTEPANMADMAAIPSPEHMRSIAAEAAQRVEADRAHQRADLRAYVVGAVVAAVRNRAAQGTTRASASFTSLGLVKACPLLTAEQQLAVIASAAEELVTAGYAVQAAMRSPLTIHSGEDPVWMPPAKLTEFFDQHASALLPAGWVLSLRVAWGEE